MAAKKKIEGTESGIIDIITKMVSEGEKEEKIIETLKELGVDSEKAKRLLLLGQADTFALLKGEIARIVSSEIDLEKPKLIASLQKEAEKARTEMRQKISKEVIEDVQKYEKSITGQSKTFQEQIQDTVRKMAELSDRVRDKLNEQGIVLQKLQVDSEEMKLKGVGKRNWGVSILLIAIGIAFIAIDMYLFVDKFLPAGSVLKPDAIAFAVLFAFVGVSMLLMGTVL